MTLPGWERLMADASVTVEDLERDIEKWLALCTSRDGVALFNVARLTLGRSLAPSTCLPGIVSIAKLLYICLQRCPNGVIPRSRFTRALVNVHSKANLELGDRHGNQTMAVAAELMQLTRCALAKVRRGRLVPWAVYAHRAYTWPPSRSVVRGPTTGHPDLVISRERIWS